MSFYLINAGVVLAMMLVLWLVSIRVKDVSFIDAFWGFGFVFVAWAGLSTAQILGADALLLVLLVSLWGIRLGVHLFIRWKAHGIDRRYAALLKDRPGNIHLFTLRFVFLFQGLIMWIVALPMQAGIAAGGDEAPGTLALFGALVAGIGLFFEAVGDAQLNAFKKAGGEGVMDKGLWHYTRHPNYFGDCCFWWGIYLIALEAGAPLWSVIGPALMTFLLLKFSGVALLERGLKKSRPGYEDYIRRTSSFIPWWPSA